MNSIIKLRRKTYSLVSPPLRGRMHSTFLLETYIYTIAANVSTLTRNMDGCGKSLILLILSLITLCCSLVLFIIGLFTVSWMKTSGVGTSYDYGLFKERDCDRDRCTYTTWSEIMNEGKNEVKHRPFFFCGSILF